MSTSWLGEFFFSNVILDESIIPLNLLLLWLPTARTQATLGTVTPLMLHSAELSNWPGSPSELFQGMPVLSFPHGVLPPCGQ